MNKNGGGFINSFFYELDFYGIGNMTDDSLSQTWSVKWEWDCCFTMKIKKSMEWTDEWIFWLWLKFIDKSFKLGRKKSLPGFSQGADAANHYSKTWYAIRHLILFNLLLKEISFFPFFVFFVSGMFVSFYLLLLASSRSIFAILFNPDAFSFHFFQTGMKEKRTYLEYVKHRISFNLVHFFCSFSLRLSSYLLRITNWNALVRFVSKRIQLVNTEQNAGKESV